MRSTHRRQESLLVQFTARHSTDAGKPTLIEALENRVLLSGVMHSASEAASSAVLAARSSHGAAYAPAAASASITVTAPSNQSATVGISDSFSLGSFTQSGGTSPYQITVDWGDGTQTGFAITSAGAIPTLPHTFAAIGAKSAFVEVTDANNVVSNIAYFTINVFSVVPGASITVTPPADQSATALQSDSFSLGSFTETGGTAPYSVSVSWGDGSSSVTSVTSPGTIPSLSHTFSASETASAFVEVIDADNVVSNAASFTINVAPPIPTVTVTPPSNQTAIVGKSQNFNLGSFVQINTTAPYQVLVTWGDGSSSNVSVDSAGVIPQVSHVYATTGYETAAVTVTDANNVVSNLATFAITVSLAANIVVTPPANQTATLNQSQSFILGSFTETGAAAPYRMSVNWGDGSATGTSVTAAGVIPAMSHTYTAVGAKSAFVEVIDANGVISNFAYFTVNVSAAVVGSPSITVTPASNQTATVGQTQLFNLGSFTESGATGPYQLSVTWGDGGAASVAVTAAGALPQISHSYSAAGSETVTVTVIDANDVVSNHATFTIDVGQSSSASITVTPPANQTATVGQSQSFSLGSFVESGGTAPYQISVDWGDSSGSTFAMSGPGVIPSASHTYASSGAETAVISIIDANYVISNHASFTITVSPAGTTGASITVTPPSNQTAVAGQSQSFTLGSFVETGATAPYEVSVDWGDGNVSNFSMTGPGAIPATSHDYATGGTDTVTLSVTDANGVASPSATFSVNVASIVLTPPANQTATAGVSKSFALGGFAAVNGAAPYTITVNWGDGSGNSAFTMAGGGTITQVAHTFASVGSDVVQVSVVDANGVASNTASFFVTVASGAPTASITATPALTQTATVNVSQAIVLGSFTETGATAPYSVLVIWGDGTADSTISVTGPGAIPAQSHIFSTVGSDTVEFIVSDADGVSSGVADVTVNVNELPPAIALTPPPTQSVIAGVSSTVLLGSFTEIDATSPYTVTVNWGDGSPTTTVSVSASGVIPEQSHTYAKTGSDIVTLSVADAKGVTSNTGSFTVNVASIALAVATAQTAVAGQISTFTIGSFTEIGATGPYTVTVNWGDGSANDVFSVAGPGVIPAQAHSYFTTAGCTVQAVVSDVNGVASSTESFPVTVGPPSQFTPSLSNASFPAAIVQGGKFRAKAPVIITNTGASLKGKFTVNLYVNTGFGLDGNEVFLTSYTGNLSIKSGRSRVIRFRLTSLPAALADGTYHLLAQVIDPRGLTNVTASVPAVQIQAPFVQPSVSVGAVNPDVIPSGGAGSLLVTVTNNGNVAASGVDITLNPSTDGVTPSVSTVIGSFRCSATLLPGKSKTFRLRFTVTPDMVAVSYFPYVCASLGGITATTCGLDTFNVA